MASNVALPTPAHSVANMDDMTMADFDSHKRKRSPHDLGDRSQKKAHLSDASLSLLHTDVGPPYLCCKTRKNPLYLMSIYSKTVFG